MSSFSVVFFLHLRYWAVNGRYSYSASLMKDQGSARVSIVWARNRNSWLRRADRSILDCQEVTSG